nr:hypothetical protein [uncultured Carboxylicivirga sp.]
MELTRQDIADFYGCSTPTASHRITEIKNYLNIKRKGRILINHLAKYEGLTVQECKYAIDLMKSPKNV